MQLGLVRHGIVQADLCYASVFMRLALRMGVRVYTNPAGGREIENHVTVCTVFCSAWLEWLRSSFLMVQDSVVTLTLDVTAELH